LSKPDVKKLKYVLCFNCCSIFSAKNNPDKKCPECGYCPNPRQYKNIMTYAISSVYYGHDYRQRYEKQLAETGEITARYALSGPAIILSFLAVAALSGIIGGISHDIVKKVFQVISRKAIKHKDDIRQNKIHITNDMDINIFIQHVNDFHHDFKNMEPIIKLAVKEEMFAWEKSDAVKKALKKVMKKKKFTDEDIFNATMKGLKKVEHPHKLYKPSKKDFAGFWDKIDDEDS